MCTQCRKYLWQSANYCEETTAKQRGKEIQMNFKVIFFSPNAAVSGVFVCVCRAIESVYESICNPEIVCVCVCTHLAFCHTMEGKSASELSR